MSVLGNSIKSPEGHTAWDYAQTIITLLHGIRQDIQQGEGDEPVTRRIPFGGTTDAALNNSIYSFDLPRGKRWQITGFGLFTTVAAGNISLFVNEVSGTNLLWTAPLDGINQRITGTFADDGPEVTEDDVTLIVVVTLGASIAHTGNIRIRQFDRNPNKPRKAVG